MSAYRSSKHLLFGANPFKDQTKRLQAWHEGLKFDDKGGTFNSVATRRQETQQCLSIAYQPHNPHPQIKLCMAFKAYFGRQLGRMEPQFGQCGPFHLLCLWYWALSLAESHIILKVLFNIAPVQIGWLLTREGRKKYRSLSVLIMRFSLFSYVWERQKINRSLGGCWEYERVGLNLISESDWVQ